MSKLLTITINANDVWKILQLPKNAANVYL